MLMFASSVTRGPPINPHAHPVKRVAQGNNAALSIAHCRPKISVAALVPNGANRHGHDDEYEKGGFRMALVRQWTPAHPVV